MIEPDGVNVGLMIERDRRPASIAAGATGLQRDGRGETSAAVD